MNPEVEFSTPHFRVVPGEDEETNPGVYGKALADWLTEAFRKQGTEIQDVIAEDFGRCVMLHRKPYLLWIG